MRQALVPLLAAAVFSVGVGAVLPTPAAAVVRASPTGDAQARAAALRAKVDSLRLQAEQAAEQYDAAYDRLGRVVSEHLSAETAVDAAVSAADVHSVTAGRRVRALYMSGGAPALYATVLQGANISDVLSRLQSVRRVVNGDRSQSQAASRSVSARTEAETRLASLAARQIQLQADVAARGDRVRSLLAETDALLAAADARVQLLAEQQRRQEEAAAARRAAAELARAQAQQAAVDQARALTAQQADGSVVGAGQLGLPTDVPAPTAAAALAVADAATHLGTPYVWGATGPGAFDCSGLTLTAYRAAGIALPRTAAEQWSAGPQVGLGDLQPGDLLFWASDPTSIASIHHVAIYVGNGQMIAAPHAGTLVRIQPVYLDGFFGAIRPSARA